MPSPPLVEPPSNGLAPFSLTARARQIHELLPALDTEDLGVTPVDALVDQARWHKEQAEVHQQRALLHWLECGRRLLALKARAQHGSFMRTLEDSRLGLKQDTANAMMYLARNSERVQNLLDRSPDTGIATAIVEIRHQVQLARQASAPLRVLPPVEHLPARVTIEQADAAELPLADDTVDLIVTSPPYNLGLPYGGGINDALEYGVYLTYASEWAAELHRVGTPNGRLALNVPLDTFLGGTPRPVYADWLAALEMQGWTYRTTIVWHEGNVTRSVARGSFASPSSPNVSAPVEMVIVAHKGVWGIERPGAVSDLTHEEAVAWQGPAAGMWTFRGESNPDYPGTFPEELPRRLIKLFCWPGDVVSDPFVGSGTTALVAAQLGRAVYGYDKNPRAVALARQRATQAMVKED